MLPMHPEYITKPLNYTICVQSRLNTSSKVPCYHFTVISNKPVIIAFSAKSTKLASLITASLWFFGGNSMLFAGKKRILQFNVVTSDLIMLLIIISLKKEKFGIRKVRNDWNVYIICWKCRLKPFGKLRHYDSKLNVP